MTHDSVSHQVFDALRDLVFVALCDPFAAGLASTVIEHFAFMSQIKDGTLREPTFAGVMRLLFPAATTASDGKEADFEDDVCQALFCTMLRNLASESQVFRDAVRDLLGKFSPTPGSVLASVVTDI